MQASRATHRLPRRRDPDRGPSQRVGVREKRNDGSHPVSVEWNRQLRHDDQADRTVQGREGAAIERGGLEGDTREAEAHFYTLCVWVSRAALLKQTCFRCSSTSGMVRVWRLGQVSRLWVELMSYAIKRA